MSLDRLHVRVRRDPSFQPLLPDVIASSSTRPQDPSAHLMSVIQDLLALECQDVCARAYSRRPRRCVECRPPHPSDPSGTRLVCVVANVHPRLRPLRLYACTRRGPGVAVRLNIPPWPITDRYHWQPSTSYSNLVSSALEQDGKASHTKTSPTAVLANQRRCHCEWLYPTRDVCLAADATTAAAMGTVGMRTNHETFGNEKQCHI